MDIESLRILPRQTSAKAVVDRLSTTMIPSAISMELKYGLLCSTGEDISSYGQFPFLGSTESLLEKLGFKLCDDLKNIHGGDNDESGRQPSSPLAALIDRSENKSQSDSESERLSDVLLRALDDVRDLRHRAARRRGTW